MNREEAVQKLQDAGLYAKYFGDGIWGGTHKLYSGTTIGVVYGYYSIEIKENCVMIKIVKDSLEEAVQFLVDNIKPGISDEPPVREKNSGGVEYY
jgi:hypothetical protein